MAIEGLNRAHKSSNLPRRVWHTTWKTLVFYMKASGIAIYIIESEVYSCTQLTSQKRRLQEASLVVYFRETEKKIYK